MAEKSLLKASQYDKSCCNQDNNLIAKVWWAMRETNMTSTRRGFDPCLEVILSIVALIIAQVWKLEHLTIDLPSRSIVVAKSMASF